MLKIYLSDDSATLILRLARERIMEMRIHDRTILVEEKRTWPKEYRQLMTIIAATKQARTDQHWEKKDALGSDSAQGESPRKAGARKKKA